MARSNTPTLLPLDRYAQLMGVPLAHFNNLDDGQIMDACRPFWVQSEHDELALALNQAEEKLRRHLHFDVAPTWWSETLPFGQAEAIWYADWTIAPVTPSYGHVHAFGRRAATLVAAGVTVTYNGNTASLTVEVGEGVASSEIRVYYRTADGADGAGSDGWEIRPLRVAVAGGSAQVTGNRALFVQPAIREADYPAPYDDPASYVEQVDVYRVYTDPALPVTLIWDAETGEDPTGNTTQTAAARLLDPETGQFQVRPATWDEDTEEHVAAEALRFAAPERIAVHYHAGYVLDLLGRMDAQLEEAALRLANVLLPERGIPFCDPATLKYARDREIDERTGLMYGELFAVRVAELRKRPEVVQWQAV